MSFTHPLSQTKSGQPLTDYDALAILFTTRGIAYRVTEPTEAAPYRYIEVESGYAGFVSEFRFTPDGMLDAVGAFA